ncbi:MAG TPA: GDSL-type esterase/lipase family protein [Terriglobales bacterium]|nr:GDSL-type esterase/lipase family protein [Terriglobales bacterium]
MLTIRAQGRRVEQWLVASVVTVVLSLLLTEGGVRILGLAPSLPLSHYTTDPYLPFKTRPLARTTGRAATGEYDYDYRHNSFGFRDIERPPHKPKEDVFRILALGDSFTYGAGVPFEATFLSRLERMLNARPEKHPPIEIIKAGIPRFFPEPERLLLEHYGWSFEPDLVLVVFVPNDVIDTYYGMKALTVCDGFLLTSYAARLLGSCPNPVFLLYKSSHAFRLLLSRVVSYRLERDRPVHWSEIYKANGFHEKDWQEVERQYTQMVQLAQRNRVRIDFIHIPMEEGLSIPSGAYPAERLLAFAEQHKVPFFDTLPALKTAAATGPVYWRRDGHPNERGHQVIAETLYRALTQQGALP